MKIENRVLISTEDIKKLKKLNRDAEKTKDFMKYMMEYATKKCIKKSEKKRARWRAKGYGYPEKIPTDSANSGYMIQIMCGTPYIVSLPFVRNNEYTERFKLTDEVIDALGWER